MEAGKPKSIDVWSVKSQNQLNLVVDISQPDTTVQSSKLTPKSTQKMSPQPETISNPRKFGAKRTSPHVEGRRRGPTQRNVFLNSQKEVNLPSFGPTRQRPTFNSIQYTDTAQIDNSHIPSHALNYLQFVDEHSMNSVVQRFDKHQFKSQFKNPLNEQTLYLSQVRQHNRLQPTRKDLITESSDPLNFSQPDLIRPSKTRSRQRTSTFFAKNTAVNSVQTDNSLNRKQLDSIRLPSTSHAAQRSLKMHVNLRDGAKRNPKQQQTFSQTSGFYSLKRGSVFNNRNESIAFDGHAASIALQDSIESFAPAAFSSQQDSQTPQGQTAKVQSEVKQLIFYNMSQQNYQPFFRERKNNQDERKKQLIAQQISIEQNSLFSQPSQVVNNSICANHKPLKTGLIAHEHNPVSAVISSALKVRELDIISGRKSSLRQTSNASPLSMGIRQGKLACLPQARRKQTAELQNLTSFFEGTKPPSKSQNYRAGQKRTRATAKKSSNASLEKVKAEKLPESGDKQDKTDEMTQCLNTPLIQTETPIDVRMSVCEAKQALLDTQTQGIQSSSQSHANSSHTPNKQQNRSLRMSQSASMQEPSGQNMQITNGKILQECQTPDEQVIALQKKNTSPLEENDLPQFNVSGAVTMKLTGQSSSDHTPFSPTNDYVSPDIVEPKYKKKLQVSPKNTMALELPENQSNNNLIRIDTGEQTSFKAVHHIATSETSNDKKGSNQDSPTLAKINKPSALVEVKESHRSGAIRQSQGEMTQRDSNTDYEEFRQAGIISKKFSSNMNSATHDQKFTGAAVDQPLSKVDSIQKQLINKESTNLRSSKIEGLSSDKGHSEKHSQICNPKAAKHFMKDRLHAIYMGEQDVHGFQNSERRAGKESNDLLEPEDYVITQYSLPKALTGATRTTAIGTFGATSSVASKSRSTTQQKYQAKHPSTTTHQSRVNNRFNTMAVNSPADLEQFNYQLDAKPTLSGPQGRKFSKQMARRIQHARISRRAAADQKQFTTATAPQTGSTSQPAQLQSKIRNQAADMSCHSPLASQDANSSIHRREDKVSQISLISCMGDRISRKQQNTSRIGVEMTGTQVDMTISSKEEPLLTSNDLASVMEPVKHKKEAPSSFQRRQQKNRGARPHVPQLQLKKVELEFQGDLIDTSHNTFGQLISTPSNQLPRQEIPSEHRTPLAQYRGLGPNTQNLPTSGPYRQVGDKTTRLISIDVQTDVKKSCQNPSMLNAIAQEKSIQDTLYEGGGADLLISQNWKDSAKIIVDDSKETGIETMLGSSANVTKLSQRQSKMQTKQSQEPLIDGDLVNTGETVIRSTESQNIHKNSKIINEVVVAALPIKSPGTILASDGGMLSSNDTIHQIDKSVESVPSIDAKMVPQTRREMKEPLKIKKDFATGQNSNEDVCNQSELSPQLGQKQILKNKYTPVPTVIDQDNLVLASLDGGSIQKETKNKYQEVVKKSENVRLQNNIPELSNSKMKDLTVVVKTVIKKPSNLNANKAVGQSTDYQDGQYESDRQKILESNKDVNMEAIMKLRYSSDEEDSSPNRILKQVNMCNKSAQGSSLGSEAHQALMKKIMGDVGANQTSFNSSEYVALKMQNMDPDGMDDERVRASSIGVSLDKAMVYKLQPKMIHKNTARSSQRASHNYYRTSQNSGYRRESLCSQTSSQGDGHYSRTSKSYTHTSIEDQQQLSALQQRSKLDSVIENHQQQNMMKERALQKKKRAEVARKERLLVHNTKHLMIKQARDKTPPISRDRMFEIPKTPHNRVKVTTTRVEKVWAMNYSRREETSLQQQHSPR